MAAQALANIQASAENLGISTNTSESGGKTTNTSSTDPSQTLLSGAPSLFSGLGNLNTFQSGSTFSPTDMSFVNLNPVNETSSLQALQNLNTAATITFGIMSFIPQTSGFGIRGLLGTMWSGVGITGAQALTGERSMSEAFTSALVAYGTHRIGQFASQGYKYSTALRGGRYYTVNPIGTWRIQTNISGYHMSMRNASVNLGGLFIGSDIGNE